MSKNRFQIIRTHPPKLKESHWRETIDLKEREIQSHVSHLAETERVLGRVKTELSKLQEDYEFSNKKWDHAKTILCESFDTDEVGNLFGGDEAMMQVNTMELLGHLISQHRKARGEIKRLRQRDATRRQPVGRQDMRYPDRNSYSEETPHRRRSSRSQSVGARDSHWQHEMEKLENKLNREWQDKLDQANSERRSILNRFIGRFFRDGEEIMEAEGEARLRSHYDRKEQELRTTLTNHYTKILRTREDEFRRQDGYIKEQDLKIQTLEAQARSLNEHYEQQLTEQKDAYIVEASNAANAAKLEYEKLEDFYVSEQATKQKEYNLELAHLMRLNSEASMAQKELEENYTKQTRLLRANHRQEIENLQATHDDAVIRKEREIRDLNLRFEEEKSRIATKHREDLRSQGHQLRATIDKQGQQLNDLAVSHKQELAKRDVALEQAVAAAKEAQQRIIDGLERDKETMVNDFSAKKREVESIHTRELKEQEKRSAVVMERLKNEIKARDEKLFTREKFEAVPDSRLLEQFEGIKILVGNLSTTEDWIISKGVWSDAAMKTFTVNPGRVRQLLLQDQIWWLLHDYVFCSPFRMFGKEGRQLETEWQRTFGKDPNLSIGTFTWPEPVYDAEQWRWETVKRCTEALQKPTSRFDPRAELKKNFKESRDSLILAMLDAMKAMVIVDGSTNQKIDQLAKRATAMWAEFQIQRCRLMLEMPAEQQAREEDKLALAKAKKLALTAEPGLKRYGDDSGHDLHDSQFLGEGAGSKVMAV